jgi:hypothetical protein
MLIPFSHVPRCTWRLFDGKCVSFCFTKVVESLQRLVPHRLTRQSTSNGNSFESGDQGLNAGRKECGGISNIDRKTVHVEHVLKDAV